MAFHAAVIVSLVRAEVVPALAAGSFNIQTSSMILNRVWEGNELYWLLAGHATLVLILAVVFALSARFAIRGGRPPEGRRRTSGIGERRTGCQT
jgi:hypothetical protein